MNSQEHHFYVEDAKEYGIPAAVLLYHIKFWIRHNKANSINQRDGRTWTYNSREAFIKILPYFSTDQIKRTIEKLIKAGAIIRGEYNKKSYDKTSWYAVPNEDELLDSPIGRNRPMDRAESPNRMDEIAQPIPDIKQDIKPDEGKTPSPPSNLPTKEPSLYEKFIAIRKQRFKATGDLETQFPKHTKEFDALSADEKDELLTAYEKYINDFSDKWINKMGHSFAYFWKNRDNWYVAVDPVVDEQGELEKASKEYDEVLREIKQICKDEKAFPGLSLEEQETLRAASPGRKLDFETERREKLIADVERIGHQARLLVGHICPKCGEEHQGDFESHWYCTCVGNDDRKKKSA